MLFPHLSRIERFPGGPIAPPFALKHIAGLTYANNVADATNDLDFAIGSARSDDDTEDLILPAALTKQSDANFARGNNAGMLDTGAVGNSDYYVFQIGGGTRRPYTDILCSLSPTAPVMPQGFYRKRIFGWFKRSGGTIVAFHTYEGAGGSLIFKWDSPTLDINLANTLTTARRTDAVKVPLLFSVEADMNLHTFDAAAAGFAYIYCPDMTDVAPSGTGAPQSTIGWVTTGSASGVSNNKIITSSTGTIAARADVATVDSYTASTLGFQWARR